MSVQNRGGDAPTSDVKPSGPTRVAEVVYLCPPIPIRPNFDPADRSWFERAVTEGVRLPRKGLDAETDEVLRVVKNIASNASPDVFSPFPGMTTLVLRAEIGRRLLELVTSMAPPGCGLYRLKPVWLVHLFDEPRKWREVSEKHADAIARGLNSWTHWHPASTHPPLRPKDETDAVAGEHVELAPPPMIRLTDREDYKKCPWSTDWARYHTSPPPDYLSEHARLLESYPLFFAGAMVCRREVLDLLHPHLDARVFHVMKCPVP